MHIVFSGIDGAGKSTQINLLIESLKTQGRQPLYLWTRGGYTPMFNALKDGLRRLSGGKAVPSAGPSNQRQQRLGRPAVRRLWLTLSILELVWIFGIQIRWWQLRGQIVICDRYIDDTLLDFQHNFPQEVVIHWWLWKVLCTVSAKADVTFLLLVPVEESLKRSQQKKEPFPDNSETLQWRLAQYEQLAAQRQWHVFDGRRPLAEIATEIHKIVLQQTNHQLVVTA